MIPGLAASLEVETPLAQTQPAAPLSLRRNFSWTLAGSVIYFGCQWGLTVILAKLGSAEMVGQFAFALAIVMPVIALTGLQLRVLQATDAKHEFAFGHYLGLRLLTAVCGVVIILWILSFYVRSREMAAVVLPVTLVKTIEAVSEIFFGLLQQRERMDRIALSMMMRGAVQLTVFGIIIVLTQNVAAAAWGMACVAAATLLLYDLPNGRVALHPDEIRSVQSLRKNPESALRPLWSRNALRKIAWLGLPIGIVMTMNSLTGNVPRYFIAHYLGERELGIFAAMFYLTIAGSMIITAMADPASPRLAKLFARGDRHGFCRLLLKLLGIALATGLGGFAIAVLAGKQILALLYRAEYAEQTTTFVWLMAATVPMYIASVLGVGITAMRRFHVQVPLPAVNLIFTLALAGWLIPRLRLAGAGQVVFFTAFFAMAATALLLLLCLRTGADSKKQGCAVSTD